MSTKLIRTIHPVGQGAFYSENLFDYKGDREFTIVYDCGSSSDKGLIDSEIKTIESNVIDILFISHFHCDHINGIKKLLSKKNIRCVIMPFVCPNALTQIKKLQGRLQGTEAFLGVADPYEMLYNDSKETKFIYVIPEDEIENIRELQPVERNHYEESDEYFIEENDIFNSENDRLYIHSGDSIKLGDWFYKPFITYDGNLCKIILDNVFAVNEYIDGLEGKHSNWKSLKRLISSVKNQLKSITNNINETSLLVYSSPIKHVRCCILYDICCMNCDDAVFCDVSPSRRFCQCSATCLYTGDLPLTVQNCSSIEGILKHRMIATFQIPHHGSKTGWQSNSKIVNKMNCCQDFFSYGTKNRYKLPDIPTMKRLIGSGYSIKGINEKPYTKMIQVFEV